MSRLPLYDTRDWRDRTTKNVRSYNPICQRLFDDGSQCKNKSDVVHHLIDPKDAPEKAHDWANLVATCTRCHPGGQRGETMGYKYCATMGPLANHFHGNVHVLPEWHKDYVKPPTATVAALAGTTSTAVGDAAIDRALGEWA